MSGRRRATRSVAACALLLLAPSVATGLGSAGTARATSMGTLAGDERVLLVTFADRPATDVALTRLAGLGSVRPSVPEIGVWELAPTTPATARARAVGRTGVVRAEWSLLRTTDDLTARRPAPPPTLPLLTASEPTDPLYATPSPNQQWGLHLGNWTPGLSGYDRPTIAVLDSGIDSTHEEWRDAGVLVAPRSTIRNLGTAEDIARTGHGTHVAGIAAAPANGIGVVGVAPASAAPALPGVSKVMPVQIADPLGRSTDATMIKGIRWAVNQGAKVINISSGGPGYSQAFQDTVNWAFKNGALVVASVGNEGLDDNPLNFPAGYDHVIGVGAQCDAAVAPPDCPAAFGRARFSNSNYSIDLLAPGVNIPSSVPLPVTSRQISPGYAFKDGTSMSAPYVAGVAALVYASHPGITPFQVTRILESTASRAAIGRNSTEGWGVVNALAAAQAGAPVDDLGEMNDDVKWLPKRQSVRPRPAPIRLAARADFNDDPFDVYPVILRQGERMRVTIAARRSRLALEVFRPSATSVTSRRQVSPGIGRPVRLIRPLAVVPKRLGRARGTTPGTRGVVVRALESGRHFIAVEAVAGGGDYTVKIQRL